MTQETTHTGASGKNTGHPSKRPAFQPADEYARKDVDNEDNSGDDSGQKPMSLRDEVLQDIEARIDAERMKVIGEQMAEFDGSMDAEQEAARIVEEEDDEVVETPEPEVPEVQATEADEEYDDPLADFVVMDGDTPMFVLKVDGKETYIPVDKARQQLQKHEAAEVRLQNAANFAKQLEAREAQIRAAEQALAEKMTAKQASPPSAPPAPDVSDQDLHKEAQAFVNSMFSGTDEDAVKTLTEMLGRMRSAPVAATPQIDPEAIARKAAQAARDEIRVENEQKDVVSGYAKFQKDYPDIMADQELFRHADSMTDAIEAEWKAEGRSYMPSEVMSEAGKRTREWVEKLTGKKSEPPRNPQDRQVRKRKLRPMPKPGSQKQTLREAQEPEQTPTDYVQELKRARGQA